ncbi:hypothetical protein LCGC14_2615250, partial [marine sediment metagenome]
MIKKKQESKKPRSPYDIWLELFQVFEDHHV